jgi:hypothetical protein
MAGDLDSQTGATEMNGPVSGMLPKGPFRGKAKAAKRIAAKKSGATNGGIYLDKRTPVTDQKSANFGNIHGKGPVTDSPMLGRLPKNATSKKINSKYQAAQRKIQHKSVFQDIDQKSSYGPPEL